MPVSGTHLHNKTGPDVRPLKRTFLKITDINFGRTTNEHWKEFLGDFFAPPISAVGCIYH